MKHTPHHAQRRAVVLGAPAILLGAGLYIPNALAANGATFLGAMLMVGAVMAVVIDTSNTEDGAA